ncbi:hypothetical protein PVK06_035144 [Gossypium arboreum]|uniref:Uncharacterized protein n=1 Tax=Gossypium arboreum TaxID=29729 RepID=A0ABR0NGJ1_GOSAR|nr:hypothetical protein PVK06_035144 [Gossypium arboreum]
MVDIRCLLLTTMNPDLQKQHEDMVAYDMIEHLKELYQGQARKERFDTSKALFPTQELAINVILQSWPDNYSQFVINFNKNEIDKTFPKSLRMLRTTEGNMKKTGPKPILMAHNNKGKGTAMSILRKLIRPKSAKRLLQGLQRSRTLAKGDVDLRVRNGSRFAALAVGTYTLSLPNGLCFMFRILNGSERKIELEEILEPQNTTKPEIKQQQVPQEIEEQVTVVETQPLRRFLRERDALKRYGFLITTHDDVLLMDQDEPRTYQEVVASLDFEECLKAMS